LNVSGRSVEGRAIRFLSAAPAIGVVNWEGPLLPSLAPTEHHFFSDPRTGRRRASSSTWEWVDLTRRAVLGAALIIVGAMTGCGRGPSHTPVVPSKGPAITWSSPSSIPPRHPELWAVSFVNPTEGWAAAQERGSGEFLQTTDGGQSWQFEQAVPAPAYSIDFLTSEAGWATAGDVLYRTVDGGVTWTAEYTAQALLSKLNFQTTEDGWMTMAGTTGATLLHTTDGGAVWAAASKPCASPSLGGAVSFPTLQDGWAVCGLTSNPFATTIRESTDGGNAWTSPPGKVGCGKAADIYFATPQNGVATFAFGAGGGCMLETADGGRNWTPAKGLPGSIVLNVSFYIPQRRRRAAAVCGAIRHLRRGCGLATAGAATGARERKHALWRRWRRVRRVRCVQPSLPERGRGTVLAGSAQRAAPGTQFHSRRDNVVRVGPHVLRALPGARRIH